MKISKLPVPLLDDIVKGRCLPIIGAGFSLNSEIPSGKKMLLWDSLAEKLAEELPDCPISSPIEVISTYNHKFTRIKLIERLNDLLLIREALPGKAHLAFCQCQFEVIITTNFDFLIEKGLNRVHRDCQPVIEEDQLPILREKQVTLIKLHGDMNHPSRLILTEDDYDLFLDRYPLFATYLASLLITKTPLLIGYSLEDPDFRHIWQLIGNRLGRLRRPAYVVTAAAKPYEIERYERRGISVINLPGSRENISKLLTDFFNEINSYWSKELPYVSAITEDTALADFSLPSDAVNRLCFFSLKTRLLPFYRKTIFPLAVRHGLTPITADDMISPGDSIIAKLDVLITKADVVVVDYVEESNWIKYELAKTEKTKFILLIISKENIEDIELNNIKVQYERIETIIRSHDNFWEDNDFLIRIDKWFEEVSNTLNQQLKEEPLRLLRKKEYRAAIISAVGLLESIITEHFDRSFYKRLPMQLMLNELFEQQIITSDDLKQLKSYLHVRNSIVHAGKIIRSREAHQIVEGIMGYVIKLQNVF